MLTFWPPERGCCRFPVRLDLRLPSVVSPYAIFPAVGRPLPEFHSPRRPGSATRYAVKKSGGTGSLAGFQRNDRLCSHERGFPYSEPETGRVAEPRVPRQGLRAAFNTDCSCLDRPLRPRLSSDPAACYAVEHRRRLGYVFVAGQAAGTDSGPLARDPWLGCSPELGAD